MVNKKHRKPIKIAVIAAILAVIVAWIIWGNVSLGVTHYTIASNKIPISFNHYRIVLVSDLHMQEGKCSVEVGFIWSDLLTNLERVSDHCSNIAGCVIDSSKHNLNVHETLKKTKSGGKQYDEDFRVYSKTYSL